jgi:MFS family permease
MKSARTAANVPARVTPSSVQTEESMHPSTVPAPPAATRAPFYISRNYALLWGGQAVSLLGDAVFATTLVLWIATRVTDGVSWAPLAVGAAFLAKEVPEFIVGPIAGVYADRWDKRRTMLAMDLTRAGLLVLLILAGGTATMPWLPFTPMRSFLLGTIYATLSLLTCASFLFLPSRVALIGEVVPDPLRERASGLSQSSAAVAGILGPSLAAPLFLAVGPGWALGLDALSFLLSFTALALVKAPPHARRAPVGGRGHVRRELAEGVRLILSRRALRALLVAGMLISVGLGTFETLGIFFLRANLHASAGLFGLLAGAQGAGALVGAAIGGPLAERAGVAQLLWRLTTLLGLLFILLSRLTSFAPALIVLFLVGATFAALEVAETPLLLRSTPATHVGRVVALLIPMYGLASAGASLLSGWLASALNGWQLALGGMVFGPLDTILVLAGVAVVIGGLSARGLLNEVAAGAEI